MIIYQDDEGKLRSTRVTQPTANSLMGFYTSEAEMQKILALPDPITNSRVAPTNCLITTDHVQWWTQQEVSDEATHVMATIEYSTPYSWNGMPIATGLTLIMGAARSGKSTAVRKMAADKSMQPLLITWGEPEPESLFPLAEMMRAIDIAYLWQRFKQSKINPVIIVDSFKATTHFQGSAMTKGISREMLKWLTAFSNLMSKYGVCVVATLNPQVARSEELIASMEACVTTLVEMKSHSNLVFTSRATNTRERTSVRLGNDFPEGDAQLTKMAAPRIASTFPQSPFREEDYLFVTTDFTKEIED